MDGVFIVLAVFAVAFLILGAVLLQWKPTDDWQLFYRKYSTWLAGLNAALWAHLTQQSGQLLGFVGYVPAKWKPYAVMAVFIIGWIAPVFVAHVKQAKLDADKVHA